VDEMSRRTRDAADTVDRTPAERARRARVLDRLAGGEFESGGALCDSVNAAADHEEGPIAPAPGSLRRR
jgi:hypothetical protein